MTAPSKYDLDPEALAWARTKVQAYIDQLAQWEQQAKERDAAAKALGIGAARILASRHLLGDGGCVIGAFDERRASPIGQAAFTIDVAPDPPAVAEEVRRIRREGGPGVRR